MSLNVKSTGTAFEIAPAGTHVARCYRIIDLGTQPGTDMKGNPIQQRKILVGWELLGEERMQDGKPFVTAKWYTASLSDRANLRKDLEAWRGHPFTEADLDGFDLKRVAGAYCLLQVQHEKKGDDTRDKVVGVMALPKGTPKPPPCNDLVILDFDDFNWQVYDSLHEKMRERIAGSPEFKAMNGSVDGGFTQEPAKQTAPAQAPAATSGLGAIDIADDIPW